MKRINWFLITLLGFIGIAVLILRPVPIPEEKNCLIASGTVVRIYEAGVKDVAFQLKSHGSLFYVNRGVERGLDLDNLRSKLIGHEITIKYPKYWTPLDPGNTTRHISKIESEGEIIFSEMD